MDAILPLVARHLPTLLFAGIVFFCSWAWPRLVSRFRYAKLPVLNKAYDGKPEHFMFHSAAIYQEGYQKLHDNVHRIVTPDGEHIVVPNRYLDELRQRPDEEVDVLTAFMKAMENDYIQLFPGHRNTHIVNSVVKKELTRSLVKINPMLSRAVDETVAAELPPCDDWTPVNINRTLLRMVAIISGHVFIGPDLCRRPEYLDAAVDFTTDITMAVPVVKRWPLLVRPLAKYFEPQLAKVRAHRKRMRAFLAPVIEARRAAKARGEIIPEDTLQWMLDKTDAAGITDLTELTNMQLLLTMAAIHTTTLTTTFIVYDMVSRPDVVEACRAEIQAVRAASEGGVLTTQALFNLKLVDSVMRESQRMNPPFLDSFRRFTLKALTLQDGTHIPAGCLIEAANKAVLMDPQLYPDPETFDPYRFVRLRTTDAPDPLQFKNREQYQFVSVTKENMSFGFGRHACPGRFFAANEIKLILAQLLLNYDMKLPPAPATRQDVVAGAGVAPDPTREILFRRVRS
ncbi:ent-kaurene oxidase [Niveomyces insectorum RCEF 264]|uniref:Ent-kaurene oxidase n=1 Tax=Niveomyces insectorum RCEF 264 TaxID=1081102 RepID=A0A167QUL8_9HYPO|nr:ent-kaurene oxidase [Niveomyces insectorum RCEF 264]